MLSVKITLTPENVGEQLADEVANDHQQPTGNKKHQPLGPTQHFKHRIHPQLGVERNPKHPINHYNVRDHACYTFLHAGHSHFYCKSSTSPSSAVLKPSRKNY